MRSLVKEFTDILNKQDFCLDPYETKVVKLAIKAIEQWEEEEQKKNCWGCAHLGDQRYDCRPCARFGHIDCYVRTSSIF